MNRPARRPTIPLLPRLNPARRIKRESVRRQRAITALRRRAESRLPAAPANPLGAWAVGADGSTFRTAAIVSTQAYTIREVFQTPAGSTWSIRLDVIPRTTPTTLKVNMHGGIHGVTKRTHPANGTWALAAGANAWTFELVGSTYVAGSIWETGCATAHVPGTEIDAAAECNRLAEWARLHAPATIHLPPGGLYVQSAMIRWPESAAVIGQGGRRTFFWVADLADMPDGAPVTHVMGTGAGAGTTGRNVSDTYWHGFTIYGARHTSALGRGYHAVDLGGDSDTGVALNITLEDIGIIGSAGYGMSWGGGNAKVDCYLIRCRIIFADGDLSDCKNKIDGNFHITYDRPRLGWHALGTQGTSLEPTLNLATVSVTTTNGSSVFTIPRTTDTACQPGEIATMTGPTVRGISLTGSFRVVDISGGVISLDTVTQTASSGGTSTESTVTFCCPHISDGDRAKDMRGLHMNLLYPVWRGECFGRNVLQGRGGVGGIGNGLGASYCSIVGAKGYDLTPSWVRTTGNVGSFITLNGHAQSAVDVKFYTTGGAAGFTATSTSDGCLVDDFYIEGSSTPIIARGDRTKIGKGEVRDYTVAGIELDGATVSVIQELGEDPFTATAVGGSSPTTTNVYAPSHGQGASFTVGFSGAQSGNGLIIDPSNVGTYTATRVDADNFTVPLVGSATSADPFGGNSPLARYGSTAHIAPDITVDNVTFRLSAARASGCVEVSITTRVSGAKIRNCVFSSAAGEAAAVTDNGTDTVWGPGNSGLPNCQETMALPADGSGYTLKLGDSGKMLINPSNAAAQNTVTLPNQSSTATLPEGWWIEVQANNSTGTNGIQLQTVSGTISNANNASSNPGTITSSTSGAAGKLVWRATTGWRFFPYSGTWTLA